MMNYSHYKIKIFMFLMLKEKTNNNILKMKDKIFNSLKKIKNCK